MRTPLVSVLIPVYNVEKYLERCLNSIVKQTLTNIEIICVNDGSTDGSLSILEKYQKRDSRIVIINKKNGGLPSARNAALEKANGKYVGFVDSDDYVERDMFQKLYETAERENVEVVICGAHIFPEVPRADGWLYHCLSPEYRHYDEFNPELLFQDISTTPFLWRVLIKKSLIDEYHLRLDEDILLGEDKSFQAKVYPKAKGIAVIPDKLYHYCWYREGSMMQQDVYHISTDKVKAHAKLILNIGKQMEKESAESRLQFLSWSIPFIYADYIYLPLCDKIDLAKELVDCWVGCGYFQFYKKIENWIAEQFFYFNEIKKEEIRKATVSIIVPISDSAAYLQEALNSIYGQSKKDYEIILINSGASNEIYAKLHRNLFLDKRIRLYNMPHKPYAEILNTGIELAQGDYLAFFDSDGWYGQSCAMEEWYSYAVNQKTDICVSPCSIQDDRNFCQIIDKDERVGFSSERQMFDSDFHNALYRTEYLKENKIRFRECSILTGIIFLAESLMGTSKREWYGKYTYMQRKMYRPDWISTEKVENLLEALSEVMELSLEKEDPHAHAKVLALVNSDYYKRIIINNTRAYSMPDIQCPNGENSQIKTVQYLYKIAQLMNPDLLYQGGYDLEVPYTAVLCELMRERHKFLAELSNQFNSR